MSDADPGGMGDFRISSAVIPRYGPAIATDDPFLRAHLDDPYPLYARLRDRPDDLVELPERGVLLAARHAVARGVLRDPDTFRSGLGVQWVPVEEAGVRATFIENDPPAHTRVRRAVQRWCTPRAISELARGRRRRRRGAGRPLRRGGRR